MVTALTLATATSTPDSTAVMDPWGGDVNSDATADTNNALGFDDNFSDAAEFATIPNGVASSAQSPHTLAPSSSSSPLPKISPINFIPRLHSDGDGAAPPPSLGASSSQPQPTNLLPAFPPLKDPLTQMMSSEEYISRLEAKLKRIKGGGGGGKKNGKKGLSSSAKQMIDALSDVKESHVLLSTDGSGASSESSRMDINPNFLMQRAFPERTPLTQEELEWLVKHDQLQPTDDNNEDVEPSPDS